MTTLHTRTADGYRITYLGDDIPDDPTAEAVERLRELRERAGEVIDEGGV